MSIDFANKGLPVTPVSGKRTVSLFTPHRRTPTQTQKPVSSSSDFTSTVFTRAKAVLRRSAFPGKLPARSSERAEILSFLSNHLDGKVGKGGFLYICGPPGTGKTALMNEIFSEYRECPSTETAFINCMSLERPEEVFDRIVDEFKGGIRSTGTQFEQLFIKRKVMSYELFSSALILGSSCSTKWTI